MVAILVMKQFEMSFKICVFLGHKGTLLTCFKLRFGGECVQFFIFHQSCCVFVLLTLIMLSARSAMTASYSFDFTFFISMFCGNVNSYNASVIGFEVTLAALVAFLIEMYRISVISYCLGIVGLEFTDLASNQL